MGRKLESVEEGEGTGAKQTQEKRQDASAGAGAGESAAAAAAAAAVFLSLCSKGNDTGDHMAPTFQLLLTPVERVSDEADLTCRVQGKICLEFCCPKKMNFC